MSREKEREGETERERGGVGGKERESEREIPTFRCPLSSTASAAGGDSVPGTQQPVCLQTLGRQYTHKGTRVTLC